MAAVALVAAVWPGVEAVHEEAGPSTPQRSAAQPSTLAVPAPTAAPAASAATRPRAATIPAPAAPLPPVDFFPPSTPELLRKSHEVTASGGLLAMKRLKELYQLGKDNPGDARPHLVMAEDAMNRGWDGFAVGHYERAQREDARARQDPRMLKDLVEIAGGKSEPEKAAKAIISIYGGAALRSVEDALAAAGDKGDNARAERLMALSESLSAPAPAASR